MKRKLQGMGVILLVLVMSLGTGARAGTPPHLCPYLPDHDFTEPVYQVEPTCAQAGHTEGWKCSGCDATQFVEPIPALPHTVVIDPAVAATCTETGLTQGSHCAVCDAPLTARRTIPAHGHRLVPIPAVRATCTTLGSREGSRCTLCNDTFPGAVIRYKSHWYGPWTSNGDGTHSAVCRNSGCDAKKMVACQYLEGMLDGHRMRVCPVCGDATVVLDIAPDEGGTNAGAAPGVMNAGRGTVDTGNNLQGAAPDPGMDFGAGLNPHALGLYLGIRNPDEGTSFRDTQSMAFQPIQGATAVALDKKPLTYGELVALGMNDPLRGEAISMPGQPEQKAVVLSAMTVGFESGGNWLQSAINQDIRELRENYNEFSGTWINSMRFVFTFRRSENSQSGDTLPVLVNKQKEENLPAPEVAQLVRILRASEGGQWLPVPSTFENGTLSFETVLPGLFVAVMPEPIVAQEQSLPQIPVSEQIGPQSQVPDSEPIGPLPQEQSGPQGLLESQELPGQQIPDSEPINTLPQIPDSEPINPLPQDPGFIPIQPWLQLPPGQIQDGPSNLGG